MSVSFKVSKRLALGLDIPSIFGKFLFARLDILPDVTALAFGLMRMYELQGARA